MKNDNTYGDGRTPKISKLEELKLQAIAKHDPKTYVTACDKLGIPPELPYFYEEGLELLAMESSSGKNAGQLKEDFRTKRYWENLARIALSRFSELERGESIRAKEIRRKLGRIRDVGYNVPPYSGLTKEKLWELLMKVRSEVYGKIEEEYPDVLHEMKKRNRDARMNTKNMR